MGSISVDQKQEQIVEAALKRFSHFGVAKTTMSEIADDLSISKASLYYYFPDKTALVLSVGERILGEFIEDQELVLKQSDAFEKGIYEMLDVRMAFGQKYFMMHIGDIQSDINTSDPKFKVLMEDLKAKELKIISTYIQRFQDKGFIKAVNSVETAQVLIDMLIGLWICGVHVNHKSMLPSEQLFENVKTKCKRVISIFCDGIRIIEPKNA